MWNLKTNDTNLTYKTERDYYRLRQRTHGCQAEGIVRVWDGHVHTAVFKMDKKQGLTV